MAWDGEVKARSRLKAIYVSCRVPSVTIFLPGGGGAAVQTQRELIERGRREIIEVAVGRQMGKYHGEGGREGGRGGDKYL